MLGVAVLVVAIIALRNPKPTATAAGSTTRTVTRTPSPSTSTGRSEAGSSGASSTTPSSTTPSSASPTTAVGTEPLVVLNQGLETGTAAAAAQRFRNAGWTITSTDENYQNDVVTSTAYYDPTVKGAFLAARALHRQFPTIDRVAPRFSNLPDGPVVVVLTSGYQPG